MKNEIRKYINLLNENNFITKKSSIQGNGNFATKDIPKDTNLGIGLIKINNTNNPDNDYKRFDICTYTNHSKEPNVYYKKQGNNYYFYALNNINKGDELLIDYDKFDFEGERNF